MCVQQTGCTGGYSAIGMCVQQTGCTGGNSAIGMCVQQTGCTGGNSAIGAGTDTDVVGARTPALMNPANRPCPWLQR
jgi:hypothetical protein